MNRFHVVDDIKNKHDVYRRQYFIKKFFQFLKEHPIKINNFEKKEMIPLRNKELESYTSKDKYTNDKRYRKVGDYSHYTEVLHLPHVI